ncbi:MAG: hypothetical protein ACK56I_00170, partial [bacterium]
VVVYPGAELLGLLDPGQPDGQRLLCKPPVRHVEEDQRGALQPDVTAGGGHPNATEIKQPRCAVHHQGLCGGACSF